MYGMDFALFLQTYLQQDETTFRAQARKAAEQTLKEELLLKAVAEKEGITISDEEYEKDGGQQDTTYPVGRKVHGRCQASGICP
jgi:FKBP-type peptidyl-prolyl cis-trans isomerase (trigger factor)